jgi:hypothetical protein
MGTVILARRRLTAHAPDGAFENRAPLVMRKALGVQTVS